ncbi:MAG: AMP-binding protein [Dehalococcoidales bacterium]|nr:AMP-binding protein [Dehalococcoidales bacterium]
MDLVLMLDKAVKQYRAKTAIMLNEHRLSYAALDEASNMIANALIGMKVKKGDRVAMLIGNRPEFASVYFGIIKIGAIAVPLDTRYKLTELASICGNCRPRVMISENPVPGLTPAVAPFDFLEQVITVNPAEGFTSYQQIMSTSPAGAPGVSISPEDIATISYSGGPAVHPKGACITHHSLVTEAALSGKAFHQTAEDVVMLFALPLYHMYGLSATTLTSIHCGSTVVVVPGTGVSIGSLMETIEREKGTILHAVPYIYALAAKVARREGIKNDLSSLRLYISGGAPLSVSTVQQFKQYYGKTVADIYGLTEAICQVSCPLFDGDDKIGSAGKPLPGFEVRIVDDSGKEVPANHSGEIIVKGHIMKRYYNTLQATATAIRNGWLHTGDIGKLDKDGFLFITGRKKRMIILKGQNVYPAEIEEVLSTHPSVAESKVIGVSDRLRGEIVRAFIRLKPGTEATEPEIRRFCQERMADYRVPREIVFTNALPQTTPARFGEKELKGYSKLSEMPEFKP